MPTQSEIRSAITNRIVEALQSGVIPWRKPWRAIQDKVAQPTNFTTLRPYGGINILLLRLASLDQGYPVSFWASFNQWRSIGCNVRKGEHATQIVFYRPTTRTEEGDNGERVEKSFPILKTWAVFNVAQVEGKLIEPLQTLPANNEQQKVEVCRDAFDLAVAATQADIRHGFNQAAYHRPPSDCIVMPDEERFESFSAYAETLLHELVHWSESRLNWDRSYAEGELRAEIASCFLSSALGIQNTDNLTNHAAYVQSWLKAMGDDPKFIFRAATAASAATDFILNFSRQPTAKELEAEPVS